jgi:hypothetical protein
MTTKITSSNIDNTVATSSSVTALCTTLSPQIAGIDKNAFNISLLGFKMAITEGLSVFNLVDGIVDEFEDQTGVSAPLSTALTYNSTDDFYTNNTNPTGGPADVSAGFSMGTITEPETSTVAANPSPSSLASSGTFTVPGGVTSVNAYVWGAAGYASNDGAEGWGGGGGFVSGTLAVTPAQVLSILPGDGGGSGYKTSSGAYPGGGLTGIFTTDLYPFTHGGIPNPNYSAPQAYLIAGAGGGAGNIGQAFQGGRTPLWSQGGAGGGLTGHAGGINTAQTSRNNFIGGPGPTAAGGGGGGSQTTGGEGIPGGYGSDPATPASQAGGLFTGGDGGSGRGGGGGTGYYGGGGGAGVNTGARSAGGGSSYHGNPAVTSGSTQAGEYEVVANAPSPFYSPGYGNGDTPGVGQDGFVLFSAPNPGSTTSSTIVSTTFTSTTVPTAVRIVVFEENVQTPSLNTDIVASASRDAGTTFTNVTLTDSGYVTGSSGQRILTGTASIAGQPSGQSMKWKVALANNSVKIHGVSLQWK